MRVTYRVLFGLIPLSYRADSKLFYSLTVLDTGLSGVGVPWFENVLRAPSIKDPENLLCGIRSAALPIRAGVSWVAIN